MNVRETAEPKNTTERLLDAAGKLFAKQGIRATSLKAITEYAEVNIAAVNYHFRSKDALVRAVYERSFQPLNKERLRFAHCRRVGGGRRPPGARVSPLRAVRADAANLAHEPEFHSHGRPASERTRSEVERRHPESLRRTHSPLSGGCAKSRPDVPEPDLFFWMHFLFGGVIYTLLNSHDMERMHEGQNLLDTPDTFLQQLITFGTSGLARAEISSACRFQLPKD